MKNKIQTYINNVIFIIDASSSMGGLTDQVVKVFDEQIKYLAKRSVDLEQETRVSCYLFNSSVENLVYSRDVLRMPSLAAYYFANGMTALIDGAIKGIEDGLKLPELYGDSSHLCYILTDGSENHSHNSPNKLSKLISDLPENWTVACFVPDKAGQTAAKNAGIPIGNIEIWDVSERGLKEVGEKITKTTENYMVARSTGVRGTKNLFNLNTENLKTGVIKAQLDELDASTFEIIPVRKASPIKEYVESYLKRPYIVGSAYYPLTKRETVQHHKNLIVRNRRNGKCFGGLGARQLVGLPDYEVKVSPNENKEFEIFLQSTSVNRKLVPQTQLIVLK